MRRLRYFVVFVVAALLVSSVLPGASAKRVDLVEKYSVTVKYVEKLDVVRGTAKDVKGTWMVTLEQRADKSESWRVLASSDPHKGKKKQKVANRVEREEPFDFRGQWRTCVVKKPQTPKAKKAVCGEVIEVE